MTMSFGLTLSDSQNSGPLISWVGRKVNLAALDNEPKTLQFWTGQHIKIRTYVPIFIWLGRQDSNLRMLGPKPSALPLGDGPSILLIIAQGVDIG